MPYSGEFANKASHMNMMKSEEIVDFLQNSEHIVMPTEETANKYIEHFRPISEILSNGLCSSNIANIIATDGSFYEVSKDKFLPSTKVGYVKIGSILIQMKKMDGLRAEDTGFVDPFKVAALQDDVSHLSFAMPSANILYANKKDLVEGFRYCLDKILLEFRTIKDDYKSSLRSTLFHLSKYRESVDCKEPNTIYLHKCPNVDCASNDPLFLKDIPDQQYCENCGAEVYPSDCLRIWEEVSEHTSNTGPISRFMSILEHLIPVHYIRTLKSYNQEVSNKLLSDLTFVVDGPLAIFGTGAWLHNCIMRFLHEVNNEQFEKDFNEVLVIGLQKSGQLVEYSNLISKYLKNDTIFLVEDNYRYKHITFSRNPSKNGFGYETYYGQDFIYKSKTGREFVFSLPYNFPSKSRGKDKFSELKNDYSSYNTLGKALSFIDHFECDLYQNSVIPVALAHRHTAISMRPGAKVLDLLTQEYLRK